MTHLALALLLAGSPPRPVHTYSIVARDPATGELGVAVQSHWFSVGSVVPWAEAGVGAVATQSVVGSRWARSCRGRRRGWGRWPRSRSSTPRTARWA